MKDLKEYNPLVELLPEGVDPMADDFLLKILKDKEDSCKAKRQKMARDWFRAELFYNGIQWITYDARIRRWRDTGLKKSTPKPVTNVYASYCDIFASLVSSVPLDTTYRPLNESSSLDQTSIQTANEMAEAIQQQVKYQDKQREAAPLMARHGEVYLIPYLKLPQLPYDELQKKMQTQQPLEEQMAGEQQGQPGQPSIGDLAQKVFDLSKGLPDQVEGVSNGNETEPTDSSAITGIPVLALDIGSAFEGYADEESKGLEDSPFFILVRSYPIPVLKASFPEKANDIQSTKSSAGDISRYYAGAVSKLTSGMMSGDGFFSGISESSKRDRADLKKFWLDPTINYPKGLFFMAVGDTIVHKDTLPYKDAYGKPFKNVIQIRAKRRNDSFHGRTPLDDAIPKQVQRNKLESFLELALYRCASPHWLLPNGCGVDQTSGEPGTNINYKHVSAGQNAVVKPELVSGVAPPPFAIQWIKQIDEETEYILGITKVLLGQLPPGTPAARALELLLDRAKARHGDLFFEWNARWAECMNMLLLIAKQTQPQGLYKTIKKEFGGFAQKLFDAEDFNLDLEIIPESEAPAPPRSTSGEMDLVQELVKSGIMQASPGLQFAVMNRFGLDFMVEPIAVEKEYIEREQYYLINQGKLPIIRLFDNHALHFEDHRLFTMSDEYLDWKEKFPQLAEQFEMEHLAAHQEMMGPPPGAQPPPTPESQPKKEPPNGQ